MSTLEPIGCRLVVTTFVFGTLAFGTLAARLWFRVQQRKYDASDTCLVVAMVRCCRCTM